MSDDICCKEFDDYKKKHEKMVFWVYFTIIVMGLMILFQMIIIGFRVVDAKKVEFACVDYYIKELCKINPSYCALQSGWHIIGTENTLTGNLKNDQNLLPKINLTLYHINQTLS